jgi:hypothetical protein
MLAYQVQIAQSYGNTSIKPMQQESSLFSQDDASCSPFLPHQRQTQKEIEKERA